MEVTLLVFLAVLLPIASGKGLPGAPVNLPEAIDEITGRGKKDYSLLDPYACPKNSYNDGHDPSKCIFYTY
jgi:hypothetical protein